MPITNRKFAAFTRNGRDGLGISEIPKDGFCISAFLIIRKLGNPRSILMGHLNPEANWAHIGALTADRIKAHSGWMLHSCHLVYGESPLDAAQRVLREQLDIKGKFDLSGPKVFSEVYQPRRHPEAKEHWDLQFLFEGRLSSDEFRARAPSAWLKLEFIDIDEINKHEIARAHEDILARI